MDNFDLKKYLAEGRLFEEDFKNPILDKYLELKKSIDYKTVFPTDLQSFVDSLDNTEREGLENDLAGGELYETINYSVELLVPEVAFDVESGELADSPYEFATEDEIESGEADVTTYTDGDELDEYVFGRSYEQALDFAKRYPNLIKIK